MVISKKAPASKPVAKAKGKGKAIAAPPRRRRLSSLGSSNEDENGNDDDDKAAMLAALEARGREMFGFSMPAESSAQGAERDSGSDDDEGEYHTDDGWGADGPFVTDSEEEIDEPEAAPKPAVPEVVFAPTTGGGLSFSKAEKRAFLSGNSAKMMGLKREDDGGPRKKRKAADEEEESNQRLDKTLHDMLLTSLLPGEASSNAARPVEKRNAMAGRLLELADYSLPGEGAATSKAKNLSSHPAKVRTGLIHAQQRKAELQRADAEAAGSWVKGVGGLGDLGKRGAGKRKQSEREVREFGAETGKKKGMAGSKKERSKGLGMGVGRFVGGTLKISEREIERVNGMGKGKAKKGGAKKGMRGW